MPETVSFGEAGIVTGPLAAPDGAWLARERPATPPRGKPRLLDRVREAVRTRHFSPFTEKAYVGWTKRFVSTIHWLIASLLYGSGLRLMECLRLRVKDVDFQRNEITLRNAKTTYAPFRSSWVTRT